MARHLDDGRSAERIACRYLRSRGLKLVTSNYACRLGELDLVMQDRRTLVIVEIRYRRHPGFGGAIESISMRKQMRIVRATQHFIQAHPVWRHCVVRFDVVGLSGTLAQPGIHWIAGAFTMDDLHDV